MGTGTTLYRFGEFTLDPRHHALLRHGQLIPITPKCLETLTFLVKHPGQLVQKDQLMDALWPESFVEEANLKQNIYVLRRLLGDDSNGQSFIATIPRRGYKFIGPVIETEITEDMQPENGSGAGPSSAAIQYWAQHSPFRGLQVFEPEDAWLFFGRESETEALVERLGRSRVLVVAGNSGCGKSSLVRAGLIPALHYGGSSESWRTVLFRPSANPFDYLAEVLPGQLQPGWSPQQQAEFAAGCRSKFANDPSALREAVTSLVSIHRHRTSSNGNGANGDDNPGTPHVLLVADQFEEIFTLVGDLRLRSQYIDMLLETSQCEGSVRVSLVLVLRADFYSRCLDHPGLSRCLETNLFNVPRLAGEKLRENIEKRLELAGACAEAGLIDRLLEDVGSEPGNLALLEHALDQLWAGSGGFGHTLTNHAYAAIGGLRGALGRHADQVYEGLVEPELKTLAEGIFLELVYLGENADVADIKDTRRRVSKKELLSLGSSDLVEQLIARLATARLILTGREGEEIFVEVSHEALIREWPRLREWLAENRDQLRFERRLHQAAEEWEALQRDPGALLQGTRLGQAEEWLARHPEAGGLLRKYLEASSEALEETARKEREIQERELRRQKAIARRFRWLSYAMAALFLLATGSAWLAYHQQVLEKSRVMAARAEELATRDRGQALDLAIRSWETAKTNEARLALTRTFPQPVAVLQNGSNVVGFFPDGKRVITAGPDHIARIWSVTDGRLLLTLIGHTGKIEDADFSPDGQRIVTASDDHTARIWDGNDGRLLFTLPHSDRVLCVEFFRDGMRLATGSDDHTARVWNASNGRLIATLVGHNSTVSHVGFSPDGRSIVTASWDHTARVWNSADGRLLHVLPHKAAAVIYARFSPDNQNIVTTAQDGMAEVWRADGQLLFTLQHSGTISSAIYSPDGQRILTASYDHTAEVWSSADGHLLFKLSHDGPVSYAEFSRDGQRIITASFDHTAAVWSAANGLLLATLDGHTDQVWNAAFSPDGTRVITGSADKTARIWNLAPFYSQGILDLNAGFVFSATFSRDGRRILTAHFNNVAQVWDSNSGYPLITLKGHEGEVRRAQSSFDDRLILTTSKDKAYVWSPVDGQLLATLRGHTDDVRDAQFSYDDQRIVTASLDGTARVWNSADGRPLTILQGHTGRLYSARFSPDNRLIVTSSADHTARLWNAADGALLMILKGHTDEVWSALFSSDGQHIVTASADHTARVWNADGTLLMILEGHTGKVESAQFSPDGQHILTASFDGTARVWNAFDGKLVAILQGHTDAVYGAIFSPDSRRIVTISADGTAKVWSTDGSFLANLQGHSHQVMYAAFSPDGRRIVTASLDETARVWQAVTLDDIERILSK